MTTIRWRAVESAGVETCSVEKSGAVVVVQGRIRDGADPCDYELQASADWRFRALQLTAGTRGVRVEFDDDVWTVNGEERADLVRAREVDISVTPLTNTLPIRRLALAVGESADITTAYVDVAAMTVTADPQRYTRLTARTYRYESLDSDFERVVTVDDDGFVLDYPGLFAREA